MTQKAYSSGSQYPELKQGTLRIYSSRMCPYAERARLVHEIVNINLSDKPQWFLARAPAGKVPALQHNDTILYESTAVSEYLDDVYPGDRLQPEDPHQKAVDRILLETFGQITSAFYGVLFAAGKEEKKEEVEAKVTQLHKAFGFYEEELVKKGSKFFGGSKPGMIDFYIWPHMERIPTATMMAPQVSLGKTQFPRLAEWWETMTSVPAVKKEMQDAKWHLETFKLFAQGKNGGDHGLEE